MYEKKQRKKDQTDNLIAPGKIVPVSFLLFVVVGGALATEKRRVGEMGLSNQSGTAARAPLPWPKLPQHHDPPSTPVLSLLLCPLPCPFDLYRG